MQTGELVKSRQDLLDLQKELCEKARGVMAQKNADYAKGLDPFRNFRRHGRKGIVTRMGDKLDRLDGFCESEDLAVKDESIEDTVLDIINYAVIFLGYNEECRQSISSPGLPCS